MEVCSLFIRILFVCDITVCIIAILFAVTKPVSPHDYVAACIVGVGAVKSKKQLCDSLFTARYKTAFLYETVSVADLRVGGALRRGGAMKNVVFLSSLLLIIEAEEPSNCHASNVSCLSQ